MLRDTLLLEKNVVIGANFARMRLRTGSAPTTIDVWPLMGTADSLATFTTYAAPNSRTVAVSYLLV